MSEFSEEKIRAIVRAEMEEFALELSDRLWGEASKHFQTIPGKFDMLSTISNTINDMYEPDEEATHQ